MPKVYLEYPDFEKETLKIEFKEKTFSFETYPKLIQEEALNIIKDGTLYDKYVDSISITHAGNDTTKEQLALITISLFIGEPIHTELNAGTGKGKTDVTSETVKNIPDTYVHHLSTVSPKNIYYDKESYSKFNILIFDDVILSDENIGLLKVLTDNNKPVKELKTVIDKKAVNFTLEGKFLVIITYAKDNPDEELLNRLYKLNMIIDEDSESEIKKKIRNNNIINAGHNEIISKSRQIIQAAIQYLIEQKIEIFNPFTALFDPIELENRNIGHFITLVKSKSFFHTNKLKTVEFAGKKIYIGSYEDFWAVAKIWSKENDTQKFKLNSKEKKILEILPEKTREQAIDDNEITLKEYIDADAKTRDDILDGEFTRKKIAKLIGVSETTIRNYLDRSQGTAQTLFDMGLIDKIKFNNNQQNSPWIYFKIPKEELNQEETLWQDWQTENAKHFDTLKYKIRIILSLLYLANISINEKGYIFLKKYCTDKNHTINLDDYDSYYNFINDTLHDFDFKKYAVELEDATYSELTYFIDLYESLNNEKNEDIHHNQDSKKFAKYPKTSETAQNTKPIPI